VPEDVQAETHWQSERKLVEIEIGVEEITSVRPPLLKLKSLPMRLMQKVLLPRSVRRGDVSFIPDTLSFMVIRAFLDNRSRVLEVI
jgi:hypothetical protein